MQFRDLSAQYERLKPEIDLAIQNVITNGHFILGEEVSMLEKELAEYVGVNHCISCANGTDAITLALMAYGIGKGDAVFVPDFTFFATAGSAAILGITPIFVDIDLATFNICPNALEYAIKQTLEENILIPKAIIPVDLYGLPANYPLIDEIAKKYNLIVIEDAAQGFGGEIKGKKACSFGDIATTSFFPAKPLGCYGDGGAIFTNNYEINKKLRSLRTQGASPSDKYDNCEIGMNSRLDTIQSAILRVKLKAFDSELCAVNKAAEIYSKMLDREEDIAIPSVADGYLSSWAQYTIVLPSKEKRELVQSMLKRNNIPSMVYYPRALHSQTAFKYLNIKDEKYRNTLQAVDRVLSLPMHPYIKEEDIFKVTSLLKCIMSPL